MGMSDFQETFSSELGDVPSEDKDSKNVLAQLRAIVAEEVNLPDVEIEVKQRPGVSVVYSPNISNAQLKAWRKKSSNRKTGELDNIKFACLVVGDTGRYERFGKGSRSELRQPGWFGWRLEACVF
jgi:hypothetical protein